MPRKMPVRNGLDKNAPRPTKKNRTQKSFENNDMCGSSSGYSDIETSPTAKVNGKKRCADSAINEDDCGEQCPSYLKDEVMNIVHGFTSNMNRALQSKSKRVQQYTEESVRATTKKIVEVSKTQSIERRTLWNEFQKQLDELLEDGRNTLGKCKETEERIQKVFQQQQKQMSILLGQKEQQVQAMNALKETFFKGLEEMEMSHVQQYSKVHNDIRKEMANLQKKLLQDAQQQDMLNVRNQLKNMMG